MVTPCKQTVKNNFRLALFCISFSIIGSEIYITLAQNGTIILGMEEKVQNVKNTRIILKINGFKLPPYSIKFFGKI